MAKRDYSSRVYPDIACADCGIRFKPGSSSQKRCPDCQRARNLQLAREKQKQYSDARREPRYCEGCGAELPVYRGNHSRFCAVCRPRYRKQYERQRSLDRTASGKRKQYDRRYREQNRERIQATNQRYRQAHPETDSAALHRRRQRIEAGKLDSTDRLLSAVYRLAIRNDPCFYCGAAETHCTDHFFPLAKGGSDRWFNLVRSCQPCNLSKHDKCGTSFLLGMAAA